MTMPEFFGCAFLSFGPPLAMFIFTIAHDAIRIIILIAAAFFWLLSLLASSVLWFAIVPLRDFIVFGVFFAVLFQEAFRYVIYKILRHAERGLRIVAEDPKVVENKHILAYVCGLGFGLMSGLLSMVNLLADMSGPGIMGMKGGSENFFLVSSAQALCMILLHTFWSVIFFSACDDRNYKQIGYVVGSHLLVTLVTTANIQAMYAITLTVSYIVLLVTAVIAFLVAGGNLESLMRAVKIV